MRSDLRVDIRTFFANSTQNLHHRLMVEFGEPFPRLSSLEPLTVSVTANDGNEKPTAIDLVDNLVTMSHLACNRCHREVCDTIFGLVGKQNEKGDTLLNSYGVPYNGDPESSGQTESMPVRDIASEATNKYFTPLFWSPQRETNDTHDMSISLGKH